MCGKELGGCERLVSLKSELTGSPPVAGGGESRSEAHGGARPTRRLEAIGAPARTVGEAATMTMLYAQRQRRPRQLILRIVVRERKAAWGMRGRSLCGGFGYKPWGSCT